MQLVRVFLAYFRALSGGAREGRVGRLVAPRASEPLAACMAGACAFAAIANRPAISKCCTFALADQRRVKVNV